MIDSNIVQQVLEESHIEKVIGQYVQLQRKGANFIGNCPFHDEKTPSFTVSPSKGIFKCYGCGVGGNDAASFLMKLQKIRFPEAIKKLAADLHITIEEKELSPEQQKKNETRENLIEFYEFALKYYRMRLEGTALAYAQSRMSSDSITEFEIGFAPADGNALVQYARMAGYLEEFLLTTGLIRQDDRTHQLYDFFRNRIVFPIRDHQGRLISFTGRVMPGADTKQSKYINLAESETYHKSNVLYGFNNAKTAIRTTQTAIIVEGNTDVIKLHSLDQNNVVAAMGTALTEGQLNILKRSAKSLILLYDGDSAGATAAIKNAKAAINEGFFVYLLFLPWASPVSIKKKYDIYIPVKKINLKVDPADGFNTKEQFNQFVASKIDFITYYSKFLLDAAAEDPSLKNDAIKELAQLIIKFEKGVQEVYIDICTGRGKLKTKLLRDEISSLEKSTAPREENELKVNLPPGVDAYEYEKWGFFEYNNEYYFRMKTGYEKLSNFVMTPLFHIDSTYESKRIYSLENNFGYKVVVNLDMQEMTSLQAFQRNVEGKGNFLFYGAPAQFNRLKLKLYEQTRTCSEVSVPGWQKEGFWAWSNGIITSEGFKEIDEFGVCEFEENHYFIPAFSQIYINDKSIFVAERKFKFKSSELPLRMWMDQFLKVYGNNGRIGIAFWIAAMFRDHIMSYSTNFPMLNLFGPKNTGKSAMAKSLVSLFGADHKFFNIHNGTMAGFSAFMAQFSNAMAWIDEYKNNIEFPKIEALKSIYDSNGRSRMNMDKGKKMETTEINSAGIISGQEMPTIDTALFRRVIYLTFFQDSFSKEEDENYERLKAMQKNGLTHLTTQILMHRPYFVKEYSEIYKETNNDLKSQFEDVHVVDSLITNMSMVVAAWRTIARKVDFSFNYPDMLQIAVAQITVQNNQIGKSDELGQFWDLLESLFDENLMIDKWHFRVDLTDKLKTTHAELSYSPAIKVLKFKFSSMYSLYAQHARKQGVKVLPADSLMFYLKTAKSFIGVQPTCRFTIFAKDELTGEFKTKRALTSAFCFNYNLLNRGGKGINLERENDPDSLPEPYYPTNGAVVNNVRMPAQSELPLVKTVSNEELPF